MQRSARGMGGGGRAGLARVGAGAAQWVGGWAGADLSAGGAGGVGGVATSGGGAAGGVREARAGGVVRTVADPANEAVFSRVMRDFVIAVSGVESEPISIAPAEEKVWEGAVNAKLSIPLKISRPGEFKGALKLKAVGPAFL